jgi:hypothetical protein
MKPITNDLYKKIIHISKDVKNNLQKRGLAIPVQNDDGSTSFGYFVVRRDINGLYNIFDYGNYPVVSGINLPQTAIILANNLALGKFLDSDLVKLDRQYGYTLFEEMLYQRRSINKKTSTDKKDLAFAKVSVLKNKKDLYRKQIISRFEKLRGNI